ncbi:amino acid permease [Pseudomonas gingeri]|uniref:amino acid permease n=1 Tax=Pseudomonas gingeri TaxID=117681 RepID=UPI00159FAC99|nr:amino acid permease [Pseudomonas gingeri]NVZ99113.1 amino acid permease [Pseudomonas gingeri]NWA13158.1 amino acid permease [Pseudomonas gingeri]NWA55419.1 amino acid permease [Pseudomonas gingeri]NWA95727.1 amino acid permease [Pseudomonas gingeri]NWB00815.1 amino acid permease [Pseudomonas gingeri]
MHDPNNKVSPYGALSKGLNSRQITMISIGGVIGAGFFVGSASAISAAGPAVLVSFAIAAVLVILVMGMLGELATANPDTGSFSTYAQQAMGRWAGFSIGWLYWWFYVLVIPLEAIVASDILGGWLGVPSILVGTLLICVLTATNVLSVKNFGALEYWLSLFKIVTILGFIALGTAAVFGWLPGGHARGVQHLWADGGFAPTGIAGIASALVLALFSFTGMEIVTIAAAESEDPRRNIRKAIRSVVWRMVIFYFGSIFLIVSLVAWNSPALANGSFQSALEAMNISGAAAIVQTVILVGVASTLNSAIFTASRMGYSLATRRDAPRSWGRTTTNGVPRVAILYSSAASLLLLVANYTLPQTVLVPLIATIGTIALVMYLVIAISQVILRKRAMARGESLLVKMPLFPALSYFTIFAIVAFLGLMAVVPGHQMELLVSALLSASLVAIGAWLQYRDKRSTGSTSGAHQGNAPLAG